MALHFEKYAQDGKAFVNHLAGSLGHAADTAQAGRVLKAGLSH